jgi:hypothetical protein
MLIYTWYTFRDIAVQFVHGMTMWTLYVLSMIDTEYPSLLLILYHGNCCRLSKDNLKEKVVIGLTDRLRD